MYTYPIKPNEIYHYGIKRRSGRYPWGSGDRPYQSEDVEILKEQKKREFRSAKTEEIAKRNLEIGRQRLENRKRVANIEANRYSEKIGWSNTQKAGEAHKRASDIKKVTDEILADEDRLRMLGDYTRTVRNIIVSSSAIGAVTAYGSTAAFLGSILGASAATVLTAPVLPAAAIGVAGYTYYQHTKY